MSRWPDHVLKFGEVGLGEADPEKARVTTCSSKWLTLYEEATPHQCNNFCLPMLCLHHIDVYDIVFVI